MARDGFAAVGAVAHEVNDTPVSQGLSQHVEQFNGQLRTGAMVLGGASARRLRFAPQMFLPVLGASVSSTTMTNAPRGANGNTNSSSAIPKASAHQAPSLKKR